MMMEKKKLCGYPSCRFDTDLYPTAIRFAPDTSSRNLCSFKSIAYRFQEGHVLLTLFVIY